MRRTTVAALSLLVLAGCADRQASALQIATSGGLSQTEIPTSTFRLTAFFRVQAPSAPLVVYIEGDGLAWKSRGEPSLDPTPRNPLGLRLAVIDSSPNVVYLARPCQYTKGDSRCTSAYWTDRRFSGEVMAAMDEALDAVLRRTRGHTVHLVGYSGGGAIAALLAARRQDVASLRTVAGNLDHDAVNRHHGVSLMPGSLNPISIASRLATVPQEHFVGEADGVVPSFVARNFAEAMGDGECASVTMVKDATHEEGWENFWRVAVVRLPSRR